MKEFFVWASYQAKYTNGETSTGSISTSMEVPPGTKPSDIFCQLRRSIIAHNREAEIVITVWGYEPNDPVC